MSSGPFSVGIDVGTQSAKVAIYDDHGSVAAEANQALRALETPARGVAEHPDDDLWSALSAALRDAMADFDSGGHDRRQIVAAGLCGIRNCQALLDGDGLLVGPVQSWMDDRASTTYSSDTADPRVRWVTSSSAYLTRRLTGEVADSVAAFRGRWPVDLEQWCWSEDPAVLEGCGIPAGQLVALVMPGEVVGTITQDAATATGLPAGLPVVATANDKAVEALGCGLLDTGDLLVSLGTYVAAMTVGETARADLDNGWTNFHAVPGRYLHESTGVRRGMATVSWVRDVTGSESVEALDEAAAEVARGAEGLLTVLDWLAPVDQPHRRGAFVGLDARHGPAHLHRAVMEALAMTLRAHVDGLLSELGEAAGRERLLLSGGGSRSRLAPQVVADVFARPVSTFGAQSPAARGAAVMAAVAGEVHPSYAGAVAAMVPGATTVEPDPVGVDFYAELAAIHRELPIRLDPVLRALHDLA